MIKLQTMHVISAVRIFMQTQAYQRYKTKNLVLVTPFYQKIDWVYSVAPVFAWGWELASADVSECVLRHAVSVCVLLSDSSRDNSQSSTDTASFSSSAHGSCPTSAEKLRLEPMEIVENGTVHFHLTLIWLSHAGWIISTVAVWFLFSL